MKIKAVLYNKDHLEYGLVTIPFPIPADQYDSTIQMLEALDIGDPRGRDCAVREISGPVPSLKRLEGAQINVDELDYLVKRLDSFSDGEIAQFQAMAFKLGKPGRLTMTGLIDLTFSCQKATVITDFSDLEQIGRAHYMSLHGGCAPMDKLEQLDARKTALELILNDTSGQITPYGVVYDNGMQLRPVYQGRNFPEYLYEESLMTVSLRSGHESDDSHEAVWLYLPTSERRIVRMLCRDGMESENFAKLEIRSNNLSAAVETACALERESIFDLNAMCAAISKLAQSDRAKLEAVVAHANPESAAEIRRLAENLDLFDFVPNVHTPEEYGKYMIQDSGRFDYDDNLDEFYDYGKYGHQLMEQEQGVFTGQGYIAYHGTLPLEGLMAGDPAEQYQKEQKDGMEMGGLS